MKCRLSLRHLNMLDAIANCATMAEAAGMLHITPSALTHRLREAERRLGVLLFEKQGRVLRPTTAGQILIQAGERLLSDLQQSERVAIASAGGVRHVVRLSVAVYNAFHWLPPFLSWFRCDYPEIDIKIETQGAQTPFDSLAKGQIDLIISPDMVLPGPLEAVNLFADELVAVAPAGHRFSEMVYVSGKDFLPENYLTYSLIRQPGYETDRIWTPENVMPLREENIGSVDAICELVKAGFGVSILSHWAIHPQFLSGSLVPVRATAEGLDITWRAICKNGLSRDAPERVLARGLVAWFRSNPPPGLTVQA